MKVLYLYAELMGYQIPVIKELRDSYGAQVHIVHWDHKKLTKFVAPNMENIFYYRRSEYNYIELNTLCQKINPDICYVSGWMDKSYLKVCKNLKKINIPVVAGNDTQWNGTLRQVLGALYFRFNMHKYFSFIWVAGPYQYEYARILGFKKSQILFNCLTADVNLFAKNTKLFQEFDYPKKIVFLGRFEEVKGIHLLLRSWKKIKNKKGWSLTFIGNGSLKNEIEKYENIEVIDFLQPEELSIELQNYGIMILPSLKEPYALVIHEAMAAGLPIIVSDSCGAVPNFVISNFNGFIFESGNANDLQNKIETVLNLKKNKLKEMAEKAFKTKDNINPKICAASFMSVLNMKK